MFRVTPSARDSFGTLKAPSSHPTLMLRVGVPLEEGTVPSGRLILNCQFSIENNVSKFELDRVDK